MITHVLKGMFKKIFSLPSPSLCPKEKDGPDGLTAGKYWSGAGRGEGVLSANRGVFTEIEILVRGWTR